MTFKMQNQQVQLLCVVATLLLFQWLGAVTALPFPLLSMVVVSGLILYFCRTSTLTMQDLGIHWDKQNWLKQGMFALVVLLLAIGLVFFLASFTSLEADASKLQIIKQSPLHLLGFIIMAWVTAGFCEEFIYRGFLYTRLKQLFEPYSASAYIIAILVSALLFSLGHWYQGPVGVINSFVAGVVLGALRVRFNGSLIPLIFAHGFTDTFGLISIYVR